MQIKINGKPLEEVFQAKPVKSGYTDAQGYAVMAIGFAIVAFLLKYWGWF